TALEAVRGNQSALDQYQSISENVQQQLSGFRREQEKIVRETVEEAGAKFEETAARGSAAIHEMFQLTHAVRSVLRGVGELVGLARLTRRGNSYTRTAFETNKVFEPLDELPAVIDRLGPRLEGKDVQDVEDLVKYARREISALPEAIREKVIGNVQPPVQYDREALQEVRDELDAIETEARTVETARFEQIVRNSLLYLGAWEVLLLVLAIFVIAWNPSTPEQPLLP